MPQPSHIAIIGAGVSGLSTGVSFLHAGYEVTIFAEKTSPEITSNIAAAFWMPFHCGPAAKITGWATETFRHFTEEVFIAGESLSKNQQIHGCFREKLIIYNRIAEEIPAWAQAMNAALLNTSQIPDGFASGYEVATLVMDTSIYMPYLVGLYKNLGGKFENRKVTDLAAFVNEHPITVNCSGLGARELCGDEDVYPCRGQVMRVKGKVRSGIVSSPQFAESLAFAVPRVNDTILGGTAQDSDTNTEAVEADNARMLQSLVELGVTIDPADILETKVGLRPCRDNIRLELEKVESGYVVHNYGHGGGGYTLSWGCAREVVEIVDGIKK